MIEIILTYTDNKVRYVNLLGYIKLHIFKLKFKRMKRLLFLLFVFLPILGNTQAHLGATEKEIRDLHSDKIFEVDYTDDGEKYISAFMIYGTFYYYFDKETGLSNNCMQIVDEMVYLNGQVEVYNNKYVVVSDTEWKAYLEGGGVLKINLSYNEEHKVYVFYYKS